MSTMKEKSKTETGEQTRTVIRVYSDYEKVELSRKSEYVFMMAHPVRIDDLETITIDEKGQIIDYCLVSERGENWAKRAIEGSK